MPNPNFVLFYVENPAASARFYERLLDRPPVEVSPTFALFALGSGTMLGLWSRHTVEPPPAAGPGGCELGFPLAEVDAACAVWRDRGARIVQEPVDLDFGRTFVALDPDGHRLRVFAPPPA
jgi:predicted enzyme related to lactoylglutathione lyase